MVVVNIKSLGQRITINKGKIVAGDKLFAFTVKRLAKRFSAKSYVGDLDFCIAQELVSLHGGRIEKTEVLIEGQEKLFNQTGN